MAQCEKCGVTNEYQDDPYLCRDCRPASDGAERPFAAEKEVVVDPRGYDFASRYPNIAKWIPECAGLTDAPPPRTLADVERDLVALVTRPGYTHSRTSFAEFHRLRKEHAELSTDPKLLAEAREKIRIAREAWSAARTACNDDALPELIRRRLEEELMASG